MNDLLCLRWNNHNSAFLKQLSAILRKEIYCDATVACQGKYYPVHKFVLSTCSEYFEEIFERTQCKHPFIIIKDIKQNDLESLLSYMYRGEVNVPQTTLPDLIKAAEALRIKGLAVSDYNSEDENSVESQTPRKKKQNSSRQINSNGKSCEKSSAVVTGSGESSSESCDNEEVANNEEVTHPSPESEEESMITDVKLEASENERGDEEIPETVSNPFSHSVLEEDPKFNLGSNENPECSTSWIEGFSEDFKPNMNFPQEIDNGSQLNVKIKREEEDGEDDYSSLMQSDYLTTDSFSASSCPVPGSDSDHQHRLPTQCPHCPYNAKRKWHLKTHIMRKHSFERPFKCSSCDYRCSTFETLRMHSYKHNANRKKFKCNFCSYESLFSIDVRRHTMKHTGERPFACDACDFRAVTKSHLTYHLERCLVRIKKTCNETQSPPPCND